MCPYTLGGYNFKVPPSGSYHPRSWRKKQRLLATKNSTTIILAGFEGDKEAVDQALRSTNAEHRYAALGAAARIGFLDATTLRPFLQDESLDVSYRAVELAARIPGGVDLATDLHHLVQQAELAEVTAFVLGELGVVQHSIVEALSNQALDHDDPLCRESAVAALGALGTGLETVLKATSDIATVRRRAVICLAAFEGNKVDAALQQALNDRDWQVRQAAEDLLPPDEEE